MERSVSSVARNRNVEMPRAGESQLSLSVRQEGSGAMRMLLRAAYSLTHEPENSSCVVHPVERASLPIYRRIDSLQSAISPRTSMHSATCLTTASSITPFYIEKTKCTFSPAVDPSTAGLSLPLDSRRIHSLLACALPKEKRRRFSSMPSRADRTGLSRPSTLIDLLQNTLCFQADVFFSGTDDDVVEELNADDATDLDEPFGHLDVLT